MTDRLQAAREALEPFALVAAQCDEHYDNPDHYSPTIEDFRRAREALALLQSGPDTSITGFDAGLEAAAKWHDSEAARIRGMCQWHGQDRLYLEAIGDHEQAAIEIRALRGSRPDTSRQSSETADLRGIRFYSLQDEQACRVRFVAALDAAAEGQGKRIAELEAALLSAIKVAGEARVIWDAAPEGMRAGKLLIALAGEWKGFRADIDAIHAALPAPPPVSASKPEGA